MAQIEGLNEVLKNLGKYGNKIVQHAFLGMTKATLATEGHIKKEFRRGVTGKGFVDRTGRLRASVGHKIIFEGKKHIVGYVYAGTHYVVYVEFRWSGKYAFLWPGVKEMKKEIWKILKTETAKAIK